MTQKLVGLLERCGYRRIHATVLAQLIKVGKSTARDLEKSCDLRQPEVSLATSYLIEKKWVTATSIDSDEKRGRPTILYTLLPAEKVYEFISKERMKTVTDIGNTLTELKLAMIPQVQGEQNKQIQEKLL